MSNATDVIGYIGEGAAYCEAHGSEDMYPIFEGTETDSDILCDTCYSSAFNQGLRGKQLRDACLIQGKNIWYPHELKELAETYLTEKIATLANIKENRDKGHCLTYALDLLQSKRTLENWYTAMNVTVEQLDERIFSVLSEDTVEHYQELYGEIYEDVQDHIRSKTES